MKPTLMSRLKNRLPMPLRLKVRRWIWWARGIRLRGSLKMDDVGDWLSDRRWIVMAIWLSLPALLGWLLLVSPPAIVARQYWGAVCSNQLDYASSLARDGSLAASGCDETFSGWFFGGLAIPTALINEDTVLVRALLTDPRGRHSLVATIVASVNSEWRVTSVAGQDDRPGSQLAPASSGSGYAQLVAILAAAWLGHVLTKGRERSAKWFDRKFDAYMRILGALEQIRLTVNTWIKEVIENGSTKHAGWAQVDRSLDLLRTERAKGTVELSKPAMGIISMFLIDWDMVELTGDGKGKESMFLNLAARAHRRIRRAAEKDLEIRL